MFAEENDDTEGSESGCLDLLADVAMTQEGEEGPQGSEGKGRAPLGNGKGGHGLRQQPSFLGKRKLEGAELQVWHPSKASLC